MFNNKPNKAKRGKCHYTTTIQSTTTKHRTIEDQESFPATPKYSKKHAKKDIGNVIYRIDKSIKDSKKKKKQKTKSKKKNTKLLKTIGKCIDFYSRDSESCMSTEMMLKKSLANETIQDLKMGSSTLNIMHKMEKEKKQKQNKNDSAEFNLAVYNKMMKEVLCRPTNYPVINFDGEEQTDPNVKWLYEIQNYKEEQTQNWKFIQKLLFEFLNSAEQEEGQEECINHELQKQGKKNYRWVQITNKVSEYQLSMMESMLTHSRPKRQENFSQVLPSYNWEKYIWKDGSDESNKNYDQHSEENMISMDDDIDGIEEKVDLILNWLIDEHVLEIIENIQIFTLFKLSNSGMLFPENCSSITRQLDFQKINLFYMYCQQIDALVAEKQGNISLIMKNAFEQIRNRQKSLSNSEIGTSLKSMIISKKDVDETFPYSHQQVEQNCSQERKNVVKWLEQEIFQHEVGSLGNILKGKR